MSGRFQTHTVASEGAELDDNYQKMVADIEEQTQRSGWLFGRGAFDKADLQYLRDFNTSLRYKEVEIEDKERALWERERARVEAETAAAASEQLASALKRRNSGGSGAGGAGGAGATAGLKGPPGLASRPAPLLLPVKIKPAGSRHQTTPQHQPPATSPSEPSDRSGASCKRTRTDDAAAVSAGTSGRPLSPSAVPKGAAAAAALTLPAAKSPRRVCGTSGGGGGNGADAGPPLPQQIPSRALQGLGRSGSAPAGTSAGATGGSAAGAAGGGRGGEEGEPGPGPAGLATLLGGYGSEDDSGDEGGVAAAKSAGQQPPQQQRLSDGSHAGDRSGGVVGKLGPGKLPPPVGLLSPEELLNDPRVMVEGLVATRPVPQAVQGGDAWDSDEATSGSESD